VGEGTRKFAPGQIKLNGVTKNMGMDNVPRCQHIKMNGTQCGSPALRWRRLCFFHDRIKRERAKIAADMTAQRRFDLPLLEDANSVQVSLMKVIQMLGSGRLDHRTAGLMLYALQTASINLRHANFEARFATDVVIDRDDINRTSLGGPQWFEEDFEDESEEQEAENGTENEIDEADDKAPVAAAPAQSAAAKKEPAALNHFTAEDARRSVQGTTRNWLPETAGGNGAVKPG
jgi:hypothetical protein